MQRATHIPVTIVKHLLVSGAAFLVALCLPTTNLLAAAPTILSVSPAPGSTVSTLSRVTVTFSAPVVGVQGSDLQINDQPALAANVTNASVTFQFSQPPGGLVAMNFDSDAVITDLTGNLFDTLAPGAAWTYTLADILPPIIAVAEPAAGAVVGTLSQIEVSFNEAVSGVDASDLLVNGAAATGVTSLAADRYRFDFPTAAPGAANITWAAGHGIKDLSPAANAFAGTGWSYTVNPTAPTSVIISEILAENRTSIDDENDQKQDWIELRNTGNATVNLNGWSLTDDSALPGKWVFPSLNLAAGQHLILFASGKDRKTILATATNHTNFRLNLGGGYLGLYRASFPRVAVSELNYPEQRADISYGFTSGGAAVYFTTLTPRAANNDASAVSGFAQPPHASVQSGFFAQPFNLSLSTETPGAEIRYTIDGSIPTATNELYVGPIAISGLPRKAVATIRAVTFKPGLVPSSVTTRTYIFPDHVLTQPTDPSGFPTNWDSPCTIGVNCNDTSADYEMDPQVITNAVDNYRVLARQGLVSIPTVSVVTDVKLLFGPAQGAYVRRESNNEQPISVEYILPDGSSGFQQDCGFEIQGQTSPTDSGSDWKSKKLSMRLIFKGEFGPSKLHYKLFDDSPVDEFDTLILSAGHNMYWNYMPNDDQRKRAVYVRDQYVADLQNALGGLSHHGHWVHVYLNGLYWGLHQLHERTDDAFVASYYGGSKDEYDVIKHGAGTVVAGSSASLSTAFSIARAGLASNAAYENFQQYVDVPEFITYMMINYWVGNEDWAHKNYYASRHRVPGGKWRYHAWDSEHVMKGATYDNTTKNDSGGPSELFQLLRSNLEFRMLFADQVHKHFFNGGAFYTDTNNPIYNAAFPERNRPAARFMKAMAEIDTAIVCESARWGDVGSTRLADPLTRNRDWFNERDSLLGIRTTSGHTGSYFPLRTGIVLQQFRTAGVYPAVIPPAFSQHGGRIVPGYALFMTNLSPGTTIYYTTNGTDPRVYGSGAVAPGTLAYTSGSIALGATTVVKARSQSGTNWSALNEATFIVAELASPLRITEIMYNPPGGDIHEFIELRNTGGQVVDLDNWSFEGITFGFPPGSFINAGATLVLANNGNPTSFAARYPGVIVAGYYSGSLANGGERIALKNAAGVTIVSVVYHDNAGWPTAADGEGSSLELIDPTGASSDPANWQASAANGSPGQPNPVAATPAVVLNEVAAENLSAAENSGTFPDWIELKNTGASPVTLDGWSLSDDGNARKFVFPPVTTIKANDYLVVWCDAITNTTPGLHTGFALDREGDSVFLYNTQTQRVDAVSFGMQAANLTIGRINGSWTLNTPTPAAANSTANVAAQTDLSINEWLANAAPGTDDWVELYNRSSTLPVALRGIHLGTTGALFQVRSLAYLPPNGFVQLLANEGGGPNQIDFKLPAAGGEISLFDATAILVEKVTYSQQVQSISQGRLPNGTATVVSFGGSASPGASNYLATYTGPALNEVLARNESELSPWAEYSDWIELVNTTASPVSLAGLSLGDVAGAESQWTFPVGTSIPANGFLRVWCDDARAASTALSADMNTGFSLSGESGGVYLFNAAGQLVDSVEYGSQIADQSIGRSGGNWRLLTSPTPGTINSAVAALGAHSAVKLNEWMAEPLAGNDWFELYNSGTQPVDLAGLYLTDDPSLAGLTKHQVAPLSFIAAGGFVKFEADGDSSQGGHHVNFSLDQFGETLRLHGTNLVQLDSADSIALPPGVSAGRLPDGAASVVAFYTTPTPAESNHLPLPGVSINEVLTHTDAPLEDAIEVFNAGAQPANLGGYFLSDSKRDLKKFRIADGTTAAAGGFAVFYENQFNGGAAGSFALSSSHGGTVYLSAADAGSKLTGYRSLFRFGPQVNGTSFGRLTTSVGADVVALASRTFGADNPASLAEFRNGTGAVNAAAKIGPVVISEVMYHPVEAGAESADHEFVELHNLGATTVTLSDAAHPTNTWRLSGGVSFRFPTSVSIAPRDYVVLVHFNPLLDPSALATFRAKYGLPGTVPIHGPFTGRLGNDGDTLTLEKPDRPQGPGPDAGYVPYAVVDQVNYGDAYPWPSDADDSGASLQRRRTYAYGNDPLNWKAATATAGRANVVGSSFTDADQDGLPDDWETANGLASNNSADAQQDLDGDGHSNYEEYLDGTDLASAGSGLNAPVITAQPVDASVVPGQNVTLTLAASGSATLRYQWLKNGFPIEDATNATVNLGLANVGTTANYSASVWNGAGFTVSRSARVLVVIPPRITLQPASIAVSPGSNVTFAVAATGTGLVRYQWRRDGQEIPDATSPTLSIPNAQLADEGDYLVVITDDIATSQSAVARLLVKVAPTVAVPLVGSTNLVGSSVTFMMVANGSVPMGFQWRRGSVVLTNLVSMTRTSFFTINNLKLTDAGSYRVVLTNSGNFNPGILSPSATLAVAESPVITNQPQSQIVDPGASATFTVLAGGTAPLRYQWQFGGGDIVSATNATLTIASAQVFHQGDYRVVVSNVGASVTSSVATLTLNLPPQLSEVMRLPNGSVSFMISGAPNRTYFVEASANLTNWTNLGSVLYTNGLMPYLDATASSHTNRFYRARE